MTIHTISNILKYVVYILMSVIWDHIIHKYALIVPYVLQAGLKLVKNEQNM